MTTSTSLKPPAITDADATLEALYDDPFPIYRRLRERASVHWFPALERYFVIGYEACRQVETDPQTFLSDDPGSLQRRAMGHSMIRKDGAAHAAERKSFGNVLKPRAIAQTWDRVFAETTRQAIENFKALGPGADFHTQFAAPLAGENLRRVIGFVNATSGDVRRWSQDLIDGAGNYSDDPAVWERAARSSAEVDEAIGELQRDLLAEPDGTLLSHVLSSGLPFESVCANIKLAISGGLNEPRDVMGTIVWALLEHPEQRDRAIADPKLWMDVFDEAVRWVSPLAMYVRTTSTDAVLDGFHIPAGSDLAIVVGAANRDPAQFADPDRFDIAREKKPHLAFGNGPHFCAGSWVARSMVAHHAIPAVFDAFPYLRLDPEIPPKAGGWVFRGPLSLPVQWGRVNQAPETTPRPKVTFHEPDGNTIVVETDRPVSVMKAAVTNDVPGIVGECGGNAMCATCHVYVRESHLDRLPPMDEDEDVMLDGTAAERTHRSRLSCQLILDDQLTGIEVDVPATQV
jgi:cytochrome P450/ferredoxin